jgi:PilZ domain
MTDMERRGNSRHKSFLQGRVYFNNRRSSVDCLVREISDNGARLKFSTAVATPDVIELYIPSKEETFRAKLIWRVGDEVGVSFGPEEASAQSGQGAPASDLLGRVQALENEMIALRRSLGEVRSEVRRLKGLQE